LILKEARTLKSSVRAVFIIIETPPGGRSEAYSEPSPKVGKTRTAKTVKFSKKIDGTYYVVEAVPNTRAKTVFVVSTFINNKEHHLLADNEHNSSPTLTPDNAAVNAPEKSIAHEGEGVKTENVEPVGVS